MSNSSVPVRTAGASQAFALLLSIQIPIFPILILVPNLPGLMTQFAAVAGHEYLVPMIITVPAAGLVLLSPVAGGLADLVGRRRLLLGGLALYTICSLLPLALHELKSILAAQAGVGVADAVIMTSGNSLLGDYFTSLGQRKWLGMQSIAVPFLSAAVTLAAGLLGTVSWRAPFLINGIGAVAWGWIFLATWEPAKANQAARDPLETQEVQFPWRRMAAIGSVTLATSFCYYAAALHLGLIFAALGATSSGTISVLIMLCNIGIVGAGFYFRSQHRGTAANLCLLYGGFALGLLGMGLAGGYLASLPFAILLHFGVGLTIPLLIGWVLSSVDFRYRGRAMGIFMSCFFCGQFICPPVITLLTHAAGGILHAVVVVGIACASMALISLAAARMNSRLGRPIVAYPANP